jgi:CP family cyanate transporter-like MFS transporter
MRAAVRPGAVLLIGAITFLSLNLRPALVAVGPLASQIRATTGLTSAATSLLTTLPLICFGVFAMVAPRVGRALGLERAVEFALVLLIAGIALRAAAPTWALFGGSALAGTGIALGNVLLPGLVKRDFHERPGPIMALYSMALNGGATLAAALTVPIGKALNTGWRPTLAFWGVLVVVAAIIWLPETLRTRPEAAPSAVHVHLRVWRSSLAWAVAGFFGFQSFVFYALTAWLPSLLEAHGMGSSEAGLMLALVGFFGIPASFVVPIHAARHRSQGILVVATASLFLVGLLGLLVAPVAAPVVWTIFLGLGQGAGISLALTLLILRCRTAEASAELSGMAQTVGYLIAALGPLTVGVLHGATGAWTVPVIALIVALGPLLITGLTAAADRTLEPEPAG